jgi:hypothetical protein
MGFPDASQLKFRYPAQPTSGLMSELLAERCAEDGSMPSFPHDAQYLLPAALFDIT